MAAAPTLLEVLQELEESSDYWSEYDVPLGIVERIKDAIALATVAKACAPHPCASTTGSTPSCR